MYDVTRPQSFYSLKTWMEDVYGFAPGDVCLMIVGNKADLSPVLVLFFNVFPSQIAQKIAHLMV